MPRMRNAAARSVNVRVRILVSGGLSVRHLVAAGKCSFIICETVPLAHMRKMNLIFK